MNLDVVYLKPESALSNVLAEWANAAGLAVDNYDIRMDEHTADGLLLITENQDLDRELDDLHTLFDTKHLPTQKIDINGTLQVAVSNFNMWLRNNKCKNVLILGSEKLIQNENLQRFLERIK